MMEIGGTIKHWSLRIRLKIIILRMLGLGLSEGYQGYQNIAYVRVRVRIKNKKNKKNSFFKSKKG